MIVPAVGILVGILSLVFAIPKTRRYLLQKFNYLDFPSNLTSTSIHKMTTTPGLEINLDYGRGSFKSVKECFFLEFTFLNNTGSRVLISNLRIADATVLLKIHPEADKDINDNSYSLKFIEETGFLKSLYAKREIAIDTNDKAKTGIPLSNEYSENDVRDLTIGLKRHSRKTDSVKYFVLKYFIKTGVDALVEVEFNY